eukprot:2736034-Amphidinium_carterae.1
MAMTPARQGGLLWRLQWTLSWCLTTTGIWRCCVCVWSAEIDCTENVDLASSSSARCPIGGTWGCGGIGGKKVWGVCCLSRTLSLRDSGVSITKRCTG